MDKRWLLILDTEDTIQKGRLCFSLQEILYDHPHMFRAVDEDSALDYCVEILGIETEVIK